MSFHSCILKLDQLASQKNAQGIPMDEAELQLCPLFSSFFGFVCKKNLYLFLSGKYI